VDEYEVIFNIEDNIEASLLVSQRLKDLCVIIDPLSPNANTGMRGAGVVTDQNQIYEDNCYRYSPAD